MQEDVTRRAGPYKGDGLVKEFPFSFYVFSADDVKVETSEVESVTAVTLEKDVDYSVSVNADQDATPGGTITLVTPLATGYVLSILSNVAYTQEVQLTNFSRFPPQILNAALDRIVIQIQQLKELAERHLTVPATSDKTPQQVLTEILNIASTANHYLSESKQILDKAILVDSNVTASANAVALMKASVDTSEQNVTNIAAQVNEYSDELMLVADNLTDIDAIGTNITAIQAVSNDLRSLPVHRYDCGPISEPLTPANGIGGVLQICAENIDIIRQVAESLENATELTSLAEVVGEIGSTDYSQIDETGSTGA